MFPQAQRRKSDRSKFGGRSVAFVWANERALLGETGPAIVRSCAQFLLEPRGSCGAPDDKLFLNPLSGHVENKPDTRGGLHSIESFLVIVRFDPCPLRRCFQKRSRRKAGPRNNAVAGQALANVFGSGYAAAAFSPAAAPTRRL